MKRLLTLCFFLSLSMLTVADEKSDYTAQVDAYHQTRLQKLTRPDGYLSLVGLEWVKPEPRTIEGVGKAWLEGDQVVIDLEPGYQLEGQAVETVTLDSNRSEGDQVVQRGTRGFYVIKRGPWVGLRMKDSEAETLVKFTGVPRFAVDPAWRLQGRLVPEVREVAIGSVVGVATQEKSPGWAEFTHAGQTYRARLIGEPSEQKFFMVFSDATAGSTTYSACRFLDVDREGESLVLDFNKAINPACAFTHFATCPLPPEENVFPFEIPAGEKVPE